MMRILCFFLAGLLALQPAAAREKSSGNPLDPGAGAGAGGLRLPGDNGSLGCTVLLCMANPGGPNAIAECRPPMKELTERLAKGKSFPKCDMGGSEKGNYARKQGDLIFLFVEGEQHSIFNWKKGQVWQAPQATPGASGETRQASPDTNR